MKVIVFFTLFLTYLSGEAQDCKHFLFLQQGKTIEMTIYDKKGVPNAKKVYTVSDVSTSGGTTKGHVTTEMFDKKGKSMATANMDVQCTGGAMMVDMKMMLPQQQSQQMTANAKGDNVYLEYPSRMAVGDVLKDGTMTVEMNNSGMPATVTVTISERKIEGRESVTTDAGTWDCYKISYKGKMTIKMLIPINLNLDGTEWYAPNFGVIKSQSVKYGGTAITSIK